MLLELLSDFQISIPELGRIEARTHPVVLLTSNNSRELTEALKRRCLYLWLDYPSAEHELAIVRLHAPELPETVAAQARRGDRAGARARPQEAAVDRRVDRLGARAAAARRRRHRRGGVPPTRCRSSSSTAPTSTSSPSASACGSGWRRGRRDAAGADRRLRGGAAGRGRGGRHVRAARRVRRARRGAVDRARGRSARRSPRRWPSRPTTGACSTSCSSASSSARSRRRPSSAGCARATRARTG